MRAPFLVLALLFVSAPQLYAMPSAYAGAGQFSPLEWLTDSIESVIHAFFTAESGSNYDGSGSSFAESGSNYDGSPSDFAESGSNYDGSPSDFAESGSNYDAGPRSD